MEWARLAAVRTVLLILVGLGSLVAGAFVGLGLWGGLLALGLACLFLEYMTGNGGAPRGNSAQR